MVAPLHPAIPVEGPATVRPAALIADRRVAAMLAAIVALGAGLAGDLVAPRGPTTAANALLLMAVALAVGVIGGALARTRWILLALLVALFGGVELGRLDIVGSTLDVRLDNTFGIIAFVLTRGLHGLLVVPPLAFGVLLGTAIGRRRGSAARTPTRRRPIGTGIAGAITIGLAVLVAWPASTPPVLGRDGTPVPGSVAELVTLRVGGTDQTVMIRAADPDKPVLLYLAGGPGQSDLALARAFGSGFEQDFVFAALDQRGDGTSYAAIDPTADMTLDRAVSDVIEVTDYLRQRFGESKIYLMGESWGTILGVLAVQRRPDLYDAWIGSGQMVDVVETDRRVYADLVAYAGRVGDQSLLGELGRIGAPPYRDIPWANANLLAWYDYLYPPYTPSAGYVARGERAGLDPFGMLGSEYSLIDKANVLRGLIDTFALLYPQLYNLDFRRDVRQLHVPVVILDGAAELRGRRELAQEWFAALEAPSKQLVTYENAAHATAFEQADEVQRLLVDKVVPATYGR